MKAGIEKTNTYKIGGTDNRGIWTSITSEIRGMVQFCSGMYQKDKELFKIANNRA